MIMDISGIVRCKGGVALLGKHWCGVAEWGVAEVRLRGGGGLGFLFEDAENGILILQVD